MRVKLHTQSCLNSHKSTKYEQKNGLKTVPKADFVSFGDKRDLATLFLLQLRQIDFNQVKIDENTPEKLIIMLDKTKYTLKKKRMAKHVLSKESESARKEQQELSSESFKMLKQGLKDSIIPKVLQKHGFTLMNGKEKSRLFAPAQELVEYTLEDMFRGIAHGLVNNRIKKIPEASRSNKNAFIISDREILTFDAKTKKVNFFNSETHNNDSISIENENELKKAKNFTLLSNQVNKLKSSKKECIINKTLEELFK